jgi:phosphohistidine phosphatase
MLTLGLLRHAKSSRDGATLSDLDRPLAPRGERAAARMGAFLAQRAICPELILCSPALRARQTVELILPHLPSGPRVVYEDWLYLAPARALLAGIRKIDASVRRAMVVGHDPGMQGLVRELTATGAAEDLSALAGEFPPAALALMRIEVASWEQIGAKSGHLVLFITPKRLP